MKKYIGHIILTKNYTHSPERKSMLKIKYANFVKLIIVPLNICLMLFFAGNIVRTCFVLSYKQTILAVFLGTVVWIIASGIVNIVLLIVFDITKRVFKTIYESLRIAAIMPLTIQEAKKLLGSEENENITLETYVFAVNLCITENCFLMNAVLQSIEKYINKNIENCELREVWPQKGPNKIKNTCFSIVPIKEEINNGFKN